MRKKWLLAAACLGLLCQGWPAAEGCAAEQALADQLARDEYFMAQVLDLAGQSVAKGDEPFGAILVREGQVVGQALNSVKSEGGITRHAELNLIDQVLQKWGFRYLQDCTIYASSEPCAMCSGAMLLMKVGAVVYSAPHQYLQSFFPEFEAVPASNIFALGTHKVQVRGPVVQRQGEKILADYMEARRRAQVK